MKGIFVSGINTGVGKTFVTRALAAALRATGRKVAALKPIETGVTEQANDAFALARAAGRPELMEARGFYRHKLPLSPYAASLESGDPPPKIRALVDAVHQAARGSDVTLVEGAGGLLVPIDRRETVADLIAALGVPLLLVAPNNLGVLSAVLSTAESARARRIELRAIVLVDTQEPDDSSRTNARIIDERLGVPVFEFPNTKDDDEALAISAASSGLLDALLDAR